GAGGAVAPPRAAPEVLADLGAAAPQLGGALVEEGDAPLPVRRVDRHLQGVERAAEVVLAPAHRPVRVGLATGVEGRLDLGVPWVRHGGERHGASERAKNMAHGPAGMSAVGWNRGTPYSTVTAPDPGAGRPAARRRWPRWSAVRGLPHRRAIPRNSGRLALGRPPPPRRLRRQPDRWLYEGHALRDGAGGGLEPRLAGPGVRPVGPRPGGVSHPDGMDGQPPLAVDVEAEDVLVVLAPLAEQHLVGVDAGEELVGEVEVEPEEEPPREPARPDDLEGEEEHLEDVVLGQPEGVEVERGEAPRQHDRRHDVAEGVGEAERPLRLPPGVRGADEYEDQREHREHGERRVGEVLPDGLQRRGDRVG